MGDLIDPWAGELTTAEEVEAAYNAVHAAADVDDLATTQRLADAIRESTVATDEQKAFVAWRVGKCAAAVGSMEVARRYLQLALTGPPDLQERVYELLAELARADHVATEQFLHDTAKVVQAAQEALDRGDDAGAAGHAASGFEMTGMDDQGKAALALIAAKAHWRLGHDDTAMLWLEWAIHHGDGPQKGEATQLRDEWRAVGRADASMDDGVTAKERARVLDLAEDALAGGDDGTAFGLLNELYTVSLGEMPAAQQARLYYGLGRANYLRHQYETARQWLAMVPAGSAVAGEVAELDASLAQLIAEVDRQSGG